MAVRLHRRAAPPLPSLRTVELQEKPVAERRTEDRRASPAVSAASGALLAFPSPPSVRLEVPRPLGGRSWRDNLLMGIAAAVGGAALCAMIFAARHSFASHDAVLDGTVVEETRAITAGSAGVLHRMASTGARVEAGALLATIALPTPEPPPPVDTPVMKRLAESLRHAESVLAQARTQQAAIEELRRQERATHTETDEADAEVRRRQAERDRVAEALAKATTRPPVETLPPHRILAEAPLVLKSFDVEEGATVSAVDSVATVASPQTRVEAPLGKSPAPDETARVMLQIGGSEIAGRLDGIHVDGAIRTITIGFDAPAPLAPGTHVPVRIVRAP
jgi:hypothetical protein